MKKEKPLNLAGQTRLRYERGGEARIVENILRLTIHEGESRIEIDGLPVTDLPPSYKVWDTPAVVSALRWIATEIEKRAHATRPIVTLFKDPPERPEDLVPCPSCAGEGWSSCPLCEGRGRTVRKYADKWRKSY